MTTPKAPVDKAENHRRAQVFARFVYIGVMLTFLTICTVAVITTMNMEKNKEGFQAIQVSKPISFVDYTYVKEDKKPAENPSH